MKHCPKCRAANSPEARFCASCGHELPTHGPIVPERSDPSSQPSVHDFAGKKIAAGMCGILLGSLGIHKFILGLTTPGVIMLLVSILTCGVGGSVMALIGLIEGIIYLTKSDEEFYQLYAVAKKGWF